MSYTVVRTITYEGVELQGIKLTLAHGIDYVYGCAQCYFYVGYDMRVSNNKYRPDSDCTRVGCSDVDFFVPTNMVEKVMARLSK